LIRVNRLGGKYDILASQTIDKVRVAEEEHGLIAFARAYVDDSYHDGSKATGLGFGDVTKICRLSVLLSMLQRKSWMYATAHDVFHNMEPLEALNKYSSSNTTFVN
jgi:hypothetical protein